MNYILIIRNIYLCQVPPARYSLSARLRFARFRIINTTRKCLRTIHREIIITIVYYINFEFLCCLICILLLSAYLITIISRS